MANMNHHAAVDLSAAFATFEEVFAPRRVAHVNDLVVKIARIDGEFIWHRHDETDELFLVHEGAMEVRYRDRVVRLRRGQLHVVPRGVEHATFADAMCLALIVERAETLNTGDVEGRGLTAAEEPFVTG